MPVESADPPGLIRLFISDADAHIEDIVPLARMNLNISAAFFVFLGLIWLYNYMLQGMGDVRVPLLSGIVELVAKIGLSVLFGILWGYHGVCYAVPIGWALGLIPSAIRYHSGSWKKLSTKIVGSESPA